MIPRTLLSAGLLITTAAAGCGHESPETPPAAAQATALTPEPAPPPAQAATAVALDPTTHGWERGQRYVYQVTENSRLVLGGTTAFDFVTTGTLELTAVDVSPERATLYMGMPNASITSRLPNAQKKLDEIAVRIRATGCFVTFAGGLVSEMQMPKGLTATVANTFRDLAAGLQFARASGDTAEYAAPEFDTTGGYTAAYERGPTNDLWHKRKAKYVGILAAKSLPGDVPPVVVPQIQASNIEVHLAPDGRPNRVEAHDSVLVSGAQNSIASESSLELTGATPVAAANVDWVARMAGMVHVAADEAYGSAEPVDALDAARANGFTFETVVAELEGIAKEQRGTREVGSVNGRPVGADTREAKERKGDQKARLFEALTAIFRRDSTTVAKAVTRIRARSPASDILIDGLGSASSGVAQGALRDLMKSGTLDPALRSRVATALARTTRPDDASIGAMKAMLASEPFSAYALYTLGTYSRRLRDEGDTRRAGELGELIASKLAQTPDSSAVTTVLRAIANSGYDGAYPRVLPYIKSDDETVRVAAVQSLQSMRAPAVDATLADRLVADASSQVRVSVLEAIRVRTPTDVLARALVAAALGNGDPQVRYHAVELMIGWLPRRPDLRDTLAQIASTDAESQVRARAKAAL